ncbi:hypothetical protein D3C83_00390 [compost metagenome]
MSSTISRLGATPQRVSCSAMYCGSVGSSNERPEMLTANAGIDDSSASIWMDSRSTQRSISRILPDFSATGMNCPGINSTAGSSLSRMRTSTSKCESERSEVL